MYGIGSIVVLADGQNVFNRGCVRGNAGALWECDLREMLETISEREYRGCFGGGILEGCYYGGNAGALWECDLRGMFSGDDFRERV